MATVTGIDSGWLCRASKQSTKISLTIHQTRRHGLPQMKGQEEGEQAEGVTTAIYFEEAVGSDSDSYAGDDSFRREVEDATPRFGARRLQHQA